MVWMSCCCAKIDRKNNHKQRERRTKTKTTKNKERRTKNEERKVKHVEWSAAMAHPQLDHQPHVMALLLWTLLGLVAYRRFQPVKVWWPYTKISFAKKVSILVVITGREICSPYPAHYGQYS